MLYDKLLLIGIFCKFDTKRHLMRLHLHPFRKSDIEYRFVISTFGLVAQSKKQLQHENFMHDDLYLMESSRENMNNGKTWSYFTSVPQNYRWIAKMDMDTFLILPNVLQLFHSMKMYADAYWGAFCGRFAGGAFYALTCDVVHVLQGNRSSLKRQGPEDQLVDDWLKQLHVGNTRIDCRWGTRCIDLDTFKSPYARFVSNNTIFVHQVKTSTAWNRLLKQTNITWRF